VLIADGAGTVKDVIDAGKVAHFGLLSEAGVDYRPRPRRSASDRPAE
jgi:hypothetical protein